jgi:hypothetical protein
MYVEIVSTKVNNFQGKVFVGDWKGFLFGTTNIMRSGKELNFLGKGFDMAI